MAYQVVQAEGSQQNLVAHNFLLTLNFVSGHGGVMLAAFQRSQLRLKSRHDNSTFGSVHIQLLLHKMPSNQRPLWQEMSEMWAQGWRLAGPYLAKSYGGLAACAVLGLAAGINLV